MVDMPPGAKSPEDLLADIEAGGTGAAILPPPAPPATTPPTTPAKSATSEMGEAEMAELKELMEALTAQVADLTSRVEDVASSVGHVESDVTDVKSSLSGLQGGIMLLSSLAVGGVASLDIEGLEPMVARELVNHVKGLMVSDSGQKAAAVGDDIAAMWLKSQIENYVLKQGHDELTDDQINQILDIASAEV